MSFEDKEEFAKRRFIVDNIHFFAPANKDWDQLYLPLWSHPIFLKHFSVLTMFFNKIGMTHPKIIKTQFKLNHWKVYLSEVTLARDRRLQYLVLVDNLVQDLEQGMMGWKK